MDQRKDFQEIIEKLDEHTYHITQRQGTDAPYSHPYDREAREGIYVDVITGRPLFSSRDKYDSGCGWPAFTRPLEDAGIEERLDMSFGMRRTEVATETTHLGHVFDDGPRDAGGLRYCINGSSLEFILKEDMEERGYGAYLHLFD
ncbi:MAG: peptide-methionine (R)-S-oxide reductase MsrB [Tissierellia bacterium]|nr:peptide-methionine (R)-S-oxide reductase MsrB [Tissierellia bacterium]